MLFFHAISSFRMADDDAMLFAFPLFRTEQGKSSFQRRRRGEEVVEDLVENYDVIGLGGKGGRQALLLK